MKTTGIVFNPEQSIDLEPDAATLYDLSRYKNNGTFNAADDPDWVQLPSGLWVVSYDGTPDCCITVSSTPSLSALPKMTVMAWINLSKKANNCGIITKETNVGGTREFAFSLNVSGGIEMWLYSAAAANRLIAAITATDISGVWHHVASTWDGVNAANHSFIYIDGALQALDIDSKVGTGCVPHDGGADVRIGDAYTPGDVYSADGYIVLPTIYNYALTPGQILNIYESERWLYNV